MKRTGLQAVCLAAVLSVVMLTGCGNVFDPELYTKGILDNFYKNDAAELVQAKYDTSENAQTNYESFVNAKLYILADREVVTTEEMAEFRSIVEQILASVHYEVKGAKKTADGSYLVTVAYEPMHYCENVRKAYLEDMQLLQVQLMEQQPDAEESEISKQAEQQIYVVLKENLETQLAQITYGKPQEYEISIEKINDAWMVNLEDLNELDSLMIDWNSLLE